ncbi:Protein of unknown function [Gryllus bimaculatus]|nr:Protein of unknown function [Gryllus bimaculatus]
MQKIEEKTDGVKEEELSEEEIKSIQTARVVHHAKALAGPNLIKHAGGVARVSRLSSLSTSELGNTIVLKMRARSQP